LISVAPLSGTVATEHSKSRMIAMDIGSHPASYSDRTLVSIELKVIDNAG
jgi:hypothetical protein